MKVALVGNGAMGTIVKEMLDNVIGVVGPSMLNDLKELKEKPEVIIDFSHPSNLGMIARYASLNNVPVVLATTGYSLEDLKTIDKLSEMVPVIHSSNYSLGVILMNRLVRQVTPILKDSFDIEVIEKHHNKKIDSPSGTAKMLLNSINEDLNYDIVYGRKDYSPRSHNEIGVSSIRGGSIVGEHEVIYAGLDEVLSIKHEAFSKTIFAKGAILGAKWLINKEKGLYDMEDVLFNGR